MSPERPRSRPRRRRHVLWLSPPAPQELRPSSRGCEHGHHKRSCSNPASDYGLSSAKVFSCGPVSSSIQAHCALVNCASFDNITLHTKGTCYHLVNLILFTPCRPSIGIRRRSPFLCSREPSRLLRRAASRTRQARASHLPRQQL